MANPVILSATGNVLLVNGAERGGVGPTILTFTGASWTGSAVLKINTALPGEAVSLATVAYKNRATGITVAAGTAITADAVVEVGQNGRDLYVTYTHTSGTCAVVSLPAPMNSAVPNPIDVDVAAVDTLTVDTLATIAALTVTGAATIGTTLGTTGIHTVGYGGAGTAITAIQGTSKSGVDQAAGNLTYISNLSTGSGLPAAHVFQSGQVLGTGSTVQTAATMWTIRAGTTTAFCEFVAGQATARIIGGSSNGLAIRNNGNTRDNFRVYDSGSFAALDDGTRSLGLSVTTASGEIGAGAVFTGLRTTDYTWLIPDILAHTAGVAAGLAYHNQTAYFIGAAVANTASGFGNLRLMPGGGTVTIQGSVAVPAAGAAGSALLMSSTAGLGIYWGSGAPTVSAAQGSIYIRTDGSSSSTRLYVNSTGSTTWVNFTSAS
jgi:hypothetical protein